MNNALVSPKPLTGRLVLLMLVAFFRHRVWRELPHDEARDRGRCRGTEVDSAYSASLGYEKEIAGRPRPESAKTGRSTRGVRRGPDGGATLQVEARDNSGAPMSGLKFRGRFERPTDRRADQPG